MTQASRSERANLPDELIITTLSGAYDTIGTVLFKVAIIIFDNQSTVPIQISVNGTSTWKTFPAGEGLVLDLRDKKAEAANFGIEQGTTFFAKGAAGANTFSIAYVVASEV